jgi:hypothetical protein
MLVTDATFFLPNFFLSKKKKKKKLMQLSNHFISLITDGCGRVGLAN